MKELLIAAFRLWAVGTGFERAMRDIIITLLPNQLINQRP